MKALVMRFVRFWVPCVVGAIILGFGLSAYVSIAERLGPPVETCCGFGLVLAAFGFIAIVLEGL